MPDDNKGSGSPKDPSASAVVIDDELAAVIARFERGEYTPQERAAIDAGEAVLAAALRAGADEQTAILKGSKACHCAKGGSCPQHTRIR